MLSSEEIEKILRRYNYEELALMGVIDEIQERMGFVPPYAMRVVADTLELPLSRVYALCSFYEKFRIERGGFHTITVCTGTSCSLCGDLLASIKRELNIEPGQTTSNKMFRLDTVRCFGCCAHSPVVKFDSVMIAHPDKAQVMKSLTEMVRGGES